MKDSKRLFLVDAFALIFRGYYAFIKNPRINSRGMDTSAIFGFMNSLLDLIRKENPDYLSICFDKGGSKIRTEMYSAYKANRHETPEAIKIAIPYIQKILKEMNISVIEKEGYEADDIIGTLAKKAEKEGYKTYMVTPDKDFAQLVSENIFMYRPSRMGNGIEIWGIEEVKAKFEIDSPGQVVDYLGMMGDSVDNIPGLPGVGDKTAKKFIKEFGSMEKLLENTHVIKGKLKDKIEANKELGLLSKELAKILLNVPVDFESEKFKISTPNFETINVLFEELEFKRMKESFEKLFLNNKKSDIKSIPESINKVAKELTGQIDLFKSPGSGEFNNQLTSDFKKINLKSKNHSYQFINNSLGLDLLVEKIFKQSSVSFKVHTDNISPFKSKIIGISFCWQKKKGYYLFFPNDQKKINLILEKINLFFNNANIEKIGHDLKYDLKVLSNYKISLEGPLFDTLIAHYLINPDRRHDLDVLGNTYLNNNSKSLKEFLLENGKNKLNICEIPIENQTEFFVKDADMIFQLKLFFEKELKEAENINLFKSIELPLLKVLSKMEIEGVNIDVLFLKELSKTLGEEINRIEKIVYEQAGETFNIGSPKQLGLILFDKLKLIDKPKKTKTGQYSTAEEVLSYLAKDNKIVSNIIFWRSIKKLLNTYVEALPEQVNSKTGRIHTVYNQAVASTGRLSSNSPNLQNIPIRTETGKQVRKAFIPRDENHILLAADYSQIELRIIAALSKDPVMIKAFQNNEDIHSSTASKVFGVPIDEVTSIQRNNAKIINFGIIYGVSAFGLSQQTDLNRTEAKELIDKYYETYPKLRSYINDQIHEARENGYVKTVLGRRRYLNDILSQNAIVRGAAERNAVNAPVQGSAADIIKIAMINIDRKLSEESWKSKMILQVHDELVFDVQKNELESLKIMVKKEMEHAFLFEVPLIVNIGIGKNWLEAH